MPEQIKKQEDKVKEKKEVVETPEKEVKEDKKEIAKEKQQEESKEKEESKPGDEIKKEEVEKKEEEKPVKAKQKVKKTEAFVNVSSLPISTKHSIAVCKFIKGKKIEEAINNLEKVILLKRPVPMKGEIPHRKGIMSGRYPKKTSEHFIKLLKGLSANARVNDLENPIISEAIANLASRPYSKFGRVRKKRTHIKITVKERKIQEDKN